MGKKFSIKPTINEIPIKNIIADIEYIIDSQKSETKNTIRNKAVNILKNFLQNKKLLKNDIIKKHFMYLYKLTKKFLKENNNIIITSSDKGNVTVAMLKEDYNSKMEDLLKDSNTYKIIKKDPTLTLKNKNNALILKMYKNNIIDKSIKLKLHINNANCPRIYGNPKIHKEHFPLRPIVSSINSPAYKLSKHLTYILNNISNNDINIKNSYEFKNFINNTPIVNENQLVSFDVISLFTNIPIDKVIEIIETKWEKLKQYTNIPKESFIIMLKFCISECNYFSFNGVIYKQIDGCAMGNPLAPILACIVMDNLIETTIEKSLNKPIFFKKYVDDCITTLPITQINILLNQLNNYDPKLKFTFETEKENKIPFLDLMIIKDNRFNNYITNWYNKPTSTDRTLNYLSYHCHEYKISTISGLSHRAFTLSNNIFWKDNIQIVEKILIKNNYPIKLIKYMIRKKISEINNKNLKIKITPPIEDKNKTKHYSLLYVEQLSDNLKHMFQKEINDCHIAFKNIKTNQNLFSKTKDKIKKTEESNLIYRIPCKNCPSVYIGQTGRHLNTRLKEHNADSIKYKLKQITNQINIETVNTTSPISSPNKSALVLHSIDKNHDFNFDETKIINRHSNIKKRLVLEACEIITEEKACNLRSDVEGLSVVYTDILKKYRLSK